MNKETALDYIQNHTIIGIKAGHQRPEFLEIWMIVVQNRIFARSWGLAKRSWYNTFLDNSEKHRTRLLARPQDPPALILAGPHVSTILSTTPWQTVVNPSRPA